MKDDQDEEDRKKREEEEKKRKEEEGTQYLFMRVVISVLFFPRDITESCRL